MISSSFVKDSILQIDDAKLLGRLFTMRQTGDYDDLFDWEEADVMPLIPRVRIYIEKVSALIQENQR